MNKKIICFLSLVLMASLTACAKESPASSPIEMASEKKVTVTPVEAPQTTEKSEKTEKSETIEKKEVSAHQSTSVSYVMTNPEEVEYFGESPSFVISYFPTHIQVELLFSGPNTFASYAVDDTSFSEKVELLSFSPDSEGNGVSETLPSLLELKVQGDLATMIFHHGTGEISEPITFKRVD